MQKNLEHLDLSVISQFSSHSTLPIFAQTTVIFVLIEDSDCMEEMVGKRFGKLVIIEFEKRSPNVLSRCTCRCDCGNTIEIGLAALRKKTSCGCDYLDPRADICQ